MRRSTSSCARQTISADHPETPARWGRQATRWRWSTPETRVIGVDGLRVVDYSTTPSITNGNLNAPTIMIAEKAADLIQRREPLPASNAPYHVAADWETRQR